MLTICTAGNSMLDPLRTILATAKWEERRSCGFRCSYPVGLGRQDSVHGKRCAVAENLVLFSGHYIIVCEVFPACGGFGRPLVCCLPALAHAPERPRRTQCTV